MRTITNYPPLCNQKFVQKLAVHFLGETIELIGYNHFNHLLTLLLTTLSTGLVDSFLKEQ